MWINTLNDILVSKHFIYHITDFNSAELFREGKETIHIWVFILIFVNGGILKLKWDVHSLIYKAL